MAKRLLFRHGSHAGVVVLVQDDTYAESLLQTGYAVEVLPEEEPVVEPEETEPPVEDVAEHAPRSGRKRSK